MQFDDDTAEARSLLEMLISLSGLTKTEIQRRISEGGRHFDLANVLRGRQDLKVMHIASICGSLGLYVAEFLRMAYPDPMEPSRFQGRIERLLGRGARR
jgi:hypothetical protein